MEAYIKHRRSLKAKDIKVKDPLFFGLLLLPILHCLVHSH